MVSDCGWRRIGPHPKILAWAEAALPVAEKVLATSAEVWRCGGTWFVGVDALPNDAAGCIGGVALPWDVIGLAPVPLHRAQLSVMRPGYPQPSETESEAAYGFRLRRGAAHLDGLIADADKRRYVAEPHAWVLGLSLNACSADAAPLTVWEGSHHIMRAALAEALRPYPPENWGRVDITAAYTAARKQCFERCPRRDLPSRPSEAILIHRHLLHGVSPWVEGAEAPAAGRIIAYFRPELPDVASWIGD